MHELRAKYQEIRDLRIEDAAGGAPDPRDRMRALAARFPGALRELDALPLEMIDARLRELDAVLRGEREAPRWALAIAEYHGWMRAALVLRRSLGRGRDPSEARAWVDVSYRPGPGDPTRAELRGAALELLRPPDGRLNAWVFAKVAERSGRSVAEVEAELFPGHGALDR